MQLQWSTNSRINMRNTVYMPILLTVVCSRITATFVTIHSPGGHVGDEFNVHCTIRNHDGMAEFFRFKDGRKEFIPTGNTTKYEVYRCDKTDGDVMGEDSVLNIIKASVSDSGTYGCVPKAMNGQFKWAAMELTTITVRPACSGVDHINPSSLTTNANQGHDREQQSSQSSASVNVYAILFVVTLFALCAVVVVFLYRECHSRDQRPNAERVDQTANGDDTMVELHNTTQENLMPQPGPSA